MRTKTTLSQTTHYSKVITMAEIRKKFNVPVDAELSIELPFVDYDNRGGKHMLSDDRPAPVESRRVARCAEVHAMITFEQWWKRIQGEATIAQHPESIRTMMRRLARLAYLCGQVNGRREHEAQHDLDR